MGLVLFLFMWFQLATLAYNLACFNVHVAFSTLLTFIHIFICISFCLSYFFLSSHVSLITFFAIKWWVVSPVRNKVFSIATTTSPFVLSSDWPKILNNWNCTRWLFQWALKTFFFAQTNIVWISTLASPLTVQCLFIIS